MKERVIDGKTYVTMPVTGLSCSNCAGAFSCSLCQKLQDNDRDPCNGHETWITKKNCISDKTVLTQDQVFMIQNAIINSMKTRTFDGIFDWGERDDKEACISAAIAGATKAVFEYFGVKAG